MNVHLCLTCWHLNGTASPFYIGSNKGEHNTGIGNMLFQIASGIHYALKNNATLHAPTINTYLQYENLKKENTIFRNISTQLLPGYNETTMKRNYESLGNIFEIPFENNITVEGYFERVENFYESKKSILDQFRPTEKDKEYLYAKYPVIKDNDSLTSIHIRRGADMKKLIPKEQQKKYDSESLRALDYMVSHKKIKNVFVLTNDKQHAQNLFKNYTTLNFYYSNERDYYDIWLISLIKNNVLSRSTLAWWGSFLNEQNDKYVIGSKNIGIRPCPDFNFI